MRTEKVFVLATALLLVFCAATLLQATEYFVSPTGDDTGAGTLFSPWGSPFRGAAIMAQDSALSATVIPVADTASPNI